MKAYYYTYKKDGKKMHLMEIGTEKRIFETAKEAKAWAKALGAIAWNY